MKIFKILNPKKTGTGGDSDSEAGNNQNAGDKNLKALLEETNKKIDELTADDLQKKLNLIKNSYVSIKKGIRFAGSKQKSLNISTPNLYEKAEILKYQTQILELEAKYKIIRRKEEEDKQEEGGGLNSNNME